jgi:hypothetical protein
VTGVVFAVLKQLGGWAITYVEKLFVTMWSKGKKAESDIEMMRGMMKRDEEIATREIQAARETAKVEVETIKGANDVATKVNRFDDGDAANRLRNGWSRG